MHTGQCIWYGRLSASGRFFPNFLKLNVLCKWATVCGEGLSVEIRYFCISPQCVRARAATYSYCNVPVGGGGSIFFLLTFTCTCTILYGWPMYHGMQACLATLLHFECSELQRQGFNNIQSRFCFTQPISSQDM